MILEAADAMARRNAAELAVTEAADALTMALDELQRLGFDLNQVAELLDVDAAELSGRATTGAYRGEMPALAGYLNQPNLMMFLTQNQLNKIS